MTPVAPATHKPWYRVWRFRMIRLGRQALGVDDTPYRLAMGVACGLFCSVLPFPGQSLVGVALAKLLGGNLLVCALWSWVMNPLTVAPLFYGCYRTGAWLLGLEPLSWNAITGDLSCALQRLFSPLLLGSLTVGTILGLISFAVMLPLARHLDGKRLARRRAWAER